MDGGTRIPSLDELLHQERWLHALARRLVRDASTADDLVQETWFRTLTAGDEVRRERPEVTDVRAWLARVLRNVWRERGRAERARAGRETRAAIADVAPAARESLERFELQQRLAALVRELDEPYRSLVIWRYYEGRSAAVIAAELGEPAERVRWRLMRARALLRRRLDGDRHDWTERFAVFLPLARRGAPASAPVASPAGLVAGLGALAVGVKPLLFAGAAVLVVWALVRTLAPDGSPGPGIARGPTSLSVAQREPAAEMLAPATGSGERVPAPVSSALGGAEASATADAVLGRVRGVVRAAEDGRALAGAELVLVGAGAGFGPRMRSDDAGAFLFADVEPGEFGIACRLEGRTPLRLMELELAAGEEVALELELESGFSVSVDVVDRASGAPVAGAQVDLIAGRRDTLVWYAEEELRFHALSGVTSPAGRLELVGATRGTHHYAVQAPERATALGEVLVERGAEPLRILLERGGVVHGVVSDARGLPVEGARVFLNPVIYTKVLDELVFRQNGLATDAHGRYRLEGVPEGVYHAVALRADGSGSFHFDPAAPDARELGKILVENATEVALDFRLPAPGRVHGRVLDVAGEPVSGARVSVSWGDFKAERAGFFPIARVPGVKDSIHHTQHTDAAGRFALDSLRLSHELLELRVGCTGFVGEELELDVLPGELLEPVVTLRRLGATITGRLTDAEGGPIAGQSVGAFETEGERLGDFFHAQTAADGTSVLTLPDEPRASGLHRVRPILHSSSRLASEPELRAGVPTGASGIDFVLRAKRRLYGEVVDDTGATVRDFVVHALERADGSDTWRARDDANRGEGRFDLFVPGQTVQLRFSAPGCDPTAITDLEERGERTLVLHRAGDLVGVVRAADGHGVAGAVVALATLDSAIYPVGTGFAPRDTTDGDGRFRLRGVPDPSAAADAFAQTTAGHVLVCPRREDAPAVVRFSLPAQRGGLLELVLPRSHVVELAFADPAGDALDGDALIIDSAGWPLEPALEPHLADQADPARGRLSAGRVRFRLPPGTYHAILVRELEAREAFAFEVPDEPAASGAVQHHLFTVAGASAGR
jgi:RNA polymerase sigma-70 factor (ECF subfamily)